MAGLKTGLYDESTVKSSWQVDRIFEPSMSTDVRDQHLTKWQQAIKRSLMKI